MEQGRMRRWLADWRFVAVEMLTSIVSIVLFCAGLTLMPLMLITGGVLLLPEAAKVLHWWSDRARRRIGAHRGRPIRSLTAALAPGASLEERLRFALTPRTGRDAVWLVLDAVPKFFVTTVTLVIPLGVVNALAVPFYWQHVPADEPISAPIPVTSWETAALMPLMAIVYALVSWALIPAVARLLSAIGARLLEPPRRSRLADRIDALTVSRAAALDAHASELRRIERDLHDGAQNRLVSVVMMIGLAERSLENGADGAAAQLQRAHQAATDALAGLRRTVHDIYPPILDELGLEGALASLAGRSAVPCTLDASDVRRVPAAVESASYFIVAEALTNVNKHSGASRAWVHVLRSGSRLVISVEDDGDGGAIERPGGGFAGIRRRIEAFEGTMHLTSPPGGPTRLRAEMLCG